MFGTPQKSLQMVDPTRCQIWPGVNKADLQLAAQNEKIKTIQFSVPLSSSEIESLERLVFVRRPDITLRVYGSACDLSFLEKTPSVEKFSADCLLKGVRVESITTLEKLKELSVGIFDLENFEFLSDVPATLSKLGLYQTFSKKPSISQIGRFGNLKSLYLEAQQKGIESVSDLSGLEKIVLRSISTPDLTYLQGLKHLWSVDVKLGGIKNFDSLSSLTDLKYLELWQIRGLDDLSFISEIAPLQNLFLQSLRQVRNLPNFDKSQMLRRVYMENMKGLTNLASIESAPSLLEFCYVLAGNQQLENLLPVLRNKNVKRVLCGFGSDKKNKLFDQMIESHGKQEYRYSKFEYV